MWERENSATTPICRTREHCASLAVHKTNVNTSTYAINVAYFALILYNSAFFNPQCGSFSSFQTQGSTMCWSLVPAGFKGLLGMCIIVNICVIYCCYLPLIFTEKTIQISEMLPTVYTSTDMKWPVFRDGGWLSLTLPWMVAVSLPTWPCSLPSIKPGSCVLLCRTDKR